MIELDDEKLKNLQDIELEMLIEIDRICRENNINYSLDGGTLLGAIRHGGFIPWDDDADVIMLRQEYEKFKKVCETELDESRFFLQDFDTDSNYRWGYAKLRRNGTLFLREGQEHVNMNQGIFLDIFICDNVPDEPIKRELHRAICYLIRKGLYSEVGKENAKSSLIRIWYKLYNRIQRNTWVKLLKRIYTKNNKSRTEYVSHMTYPYPKSMKYGNYREFYDEFVDMKFEGKTFRIFKQYDRYLKLLYGDYMQLPPVEKRKVHPVSQIRFLENE